MAKSREMLRSWQGVRFHSFPLVLDRQGKNTDVYIFGGRYFSITTHSWAGVEYTGRYRFHVPAGVTPEQLCEGVWELRKMKERVDIIDAAGEKKELEREYFTIYPCDLEQPGWYAGFIGGHYKRTLAGYGLNRDYGEWVDNEAEVLARTSNRCRSGRYGSYASFVISSSPLNIEGDGIK